MKKSRPRILIYGYGNPGRLDDGLGPALADAVEKLGLPGVDVESNYQLQAEDAHTVAGYDAVIFADADINGKEPFDFRSIRSGVQTSFTSHSFEPQEVMKLAKELFGAKTRGYIIGIRGYEFNEFGEKISPKAAANLKKSVKFVRDAVKTGL